MPINSIRYYYQLYCLLPIFLTLGVTTEQFIKKCPLLDTIHSMS